MDQHTPIRKAGRPPLYRRSLRTPWLCGRRVRNDYAVFLDLARRQGMTASGLLRMLVDDALVQEECRRE